MSLEDGIFEYIEELEQGMKKLGQLICDYDEYIKKVVPHTYEQSDLVRALRTRKETLLGKESQVVIDSHSSNE